MSETKALAVIALEMGEIVHQIAENGGELTPVLEEAFDLTAGELQVKADRYAYFMDKLKAESDFWEAKADAYEKVAKSCRALRERLNENIKGAMQVLGTTEIEGGDFRFKLTRAAPKLVISQELLPSNYLMQVTETVPDKKKIREAVELGNEIPGVTQESVFALRKFINSKKGS